MLQPSLMPTSPSSTRPTLPPISSINSHLPADSYVPSWQASKPSPPTVSLPSPPPSHKHDHHDPWDHRRILPQPLLSPPQSHLPDIYPQRPAQVQITPSQPQTLPVSPAAQRAIAIRQSIEQDMEHIVTHCNTIRDAVAERQHQQVNPLSADPKDPWLDDMVSRANQVLNALLRLQKHQLAAQEEKRQSFYYGPSMAAYYTNPPTVARDTQRWQAQDELSTLKRMRQRKRRKRTVFQGRCHSCNISETPEWRRGPDGARTLCNACGLHYAKLERKRATTQTEKEDKKDDPQVPPQQ